MMATQKTGKATRHGVYRLATIVLRASAEDVSRWTEAAKRSGMNRQEWLRSAANETASRDEQKRKV